MKENIVFQVGITEQLVDLLEGFEYILVSVSPFPNLNELLYGARYVPLYHGREER